MPWVNALGLEEAEVEFRTVGEGFGPWTPIAEWDPDVYPRGVLEVSGNYVTYTSNPEGYVGAFQVRVRNPPLKSALGGRVTIVQLDYAGSDLYDMEVGVELHPPDGEVDSHVVLEVDANAGPATEADVDPNPTTQGEFDVEIAPTDEEDQAWMLVSFETLPFFTTPVQMLFEYDSTCFDCTTVNDNPTLATLRTRLARRLGFSAQADNLPPGMPELLNEFLQSAQNFMYREYPALDTRYFFQWQCVQGQRFYGLTDTEGNQCDLRLDPYKNIEGAWLIDDGGTWFPLVNGIRPTFYTSLSQEGLPGFYEIRQCLEIFPAPSNSAYQVAIKGHFGLLPFAEDTDQSTINGELVYLWALANAALYYGRHDAEALSNQAQRYLSNLVAGTHGSRRYIPGGRLPPPAIMPRPVGGW